MQNYEQIRASFAIKYKDTRFPGSEGGEVVKKVPQYIRQNGLLATAAYACEKNDKGIFINQGYRKVFECVIEYLADGARKLEGKLSVEDFIKHLSTGSSARLRDLTAETMAYLAYLRRFVKKEKEKGHADSNAD